MSRGDFVEGLRAAFYGDSSPLPVPGYLLDAALGAVLSVILERGRAGLPTYWECVGAFYPYVRPGRNMEVSVRVPVATYPYFEYVKEVRVIPARRWLQGYRIRRCRRPWQKVVYLQRVMTGSCKPC